MMYNYISVPIDGLVVGDIDGYDDGPTVGAVEIYDGQKGRVM